MKIFSLWSLVFGLVALLAPPTAQAQINMPDPSMIAGKALPAPELPSGTVSVRVVRESIGNNVVGQAVTVNAGGVTKAGKTDDAGRAQMVGFPAGAQGTAEATVDGERLVSDPFEVPASGGIRIILISGIKEAAERRAKEKAAEEAAPAVKGTVVFGENSRVMLEFRDAASGEELAVFYILEIVNTARNRVDIGGPLVIDLPDAAKDVTLLEGSSQLASVRAERRPWNWEGVKGRALAFLGAEPKRLTVTGPFPPGTTSVQVAFGLEHATDSLTFEQTWPVVMSQVLVMAQKVGDLKISSPQFDEQQETTAQNGTPFIIAGGKKALAAGETLKVNVSGLPKHPRWPHLTALGLGLLILVGGIWLGVSGGATDANAYQRLADRRESLYGELVKLEEQRRTGRIDGSKYASRRQKLLSDLEHVYGELDGRAGGGKSAA